MIANINDLYKPNEKEDILDIKISDGKNDVSITVKVLIVNQNKQIPILKSKTGFSLRLRELQRKSFTPNELNVQDADTKSDEIKIIITNSPQYGSIEKCMELVSSSVQHNQTLNFLAAHLNATTKPEYTPVTQFTMSDVSKGLISYRHQVKDVTFDRFGFVIYDGVNKLFKVDEKSEQTSNVQIFNIDIDLERDFKPVIEKNMGLDYLYQIDGRPGRLITQNELQAKDADDLDTQLIFEITRQPAYGVLENKDKTDGHLNRFTQADINANKVKNIYII